MRTNFLLALGIFILLFSKESLPDDRNGSNFTYELSTTKAEFFEGETIPSFMTLKNRYSLNDTLPNCGLSVRLDSGKTEFIVYEDIVIKITLDNSSNREKIIKSDKPVRMSIVVENENSERAKHLKGTSNDFHSVTDTIENQRIYYYNILYNWGYEEFETPNIGTYPYIPEGVYKIQAKFYYNDSCYYHSNELLITVNNPTGIEKDALDMIRSIYKINIMGSEEKTLLNLSLYSAFFEKYSGTVYTKNFFIKSMIARKMMKKTLIDDAINDALFIVEANKNNIELCELVIYRTSKYVNDRAGSEKKVEFLYLVMEKFHDSEAFAISIDILQGLLKNVRYYNY